MRMLIQAIALMIVLLLPAGSFAQETKTNLVFLRVPDSKKDTEVHISKLLLQRLNVNASLQTRPDDAEDVVLRVRFKANAEKNLPVINLLIDTRIVTRDGDSKPLSQVVSVASYAEVTPKADKTTELLQWANKLNARTIPMRVYLSGDKIVAARNLYNTVSAPLAENAVINAFKDVVRAWGPLLVDLRKNGLIEE